MSEIRDLIRELLAEEIASLRAELLGDAGAEHIRVSNGAELTEFAMSVLSRADSDPGFARAVREGRHRFVPIAAEPVPARPVPPPAAPRTTPQPQPEFKTLIASAPVQKAELRTNLITVRHIEAVAEGETRLRIFKNARLTPLAGDEARRRGIRLERTLS